MSANLLSIDVGTTHCRVSLFDPEGTRKAFASRECPVTTDASGMAEQDADEVWRSIRGLLRQAIAEAGGVEVSAVCLSVQGDAVIPVDRSGACLHPAVLGMDYRSTGQARAAERRLGGWKIFRHTGMRPHPLNALCKIMWLRDERPRVFAMARRMLTYEDFILSRLGVEPAIDVTMASRTMALDLRREAWSSWLLGRLSIEPGLLSPVVSAGTPLGTMSRALCEEVGLREPPLVVAGAHDQVCAAIGAGVPVIARAVVSTGSAEVLSTAFDGPVLTRAMYEGFYPCYRFTEPGSYFTFSLNHAGGLLLDWFRALAGGGAADRLLDDLPPGPSPVLILPHFNGSGTPWCDTRSRGAILGLSLSTTPGEITLAILEALAFELRINLERLQAAGIPIVEIAAAGGGARSPRWLQIKADVLERPIRAPAATEAASRGAAILAGMGCGAFATVEEGIAAMVPTGDLVTPNRGRARGTGSGSPSTGSCTRA
jgi:sugar (pentulose or hexulose) kinase